MKVLHVGAKNYPPAHGGTERVVYNIVNSIDDVDFYILVEWQQQETDRIFVMPEGLGYLAKMKYIHQFAKQHGIDIIHFHNEKYIPMAMLLAIRFKNIVLTVHGVHFRSPKWNMINRSIFWCVDVLGTVFLPRLVFCSEYDEKAFAKYIFFRKTYFINNGTNISPLKQTEQSIEFSDTYIYLGRITPAKNVLRLVDAATSRKIKLHIYGVLDKECQEYCDEVMGKINASDYVEYKGVVPYDQVFQTMIKYKAFLYITIMEGLPLAVLEAASCGMFLILSDIPHHTFLKVPNVKYVDVKDPQIPYPEEIPSGADNRAHILAHFSNKQMGDEYKKIYNSLKTMR
ncbi:glycosyltransferase involved in cell wall biosynthesis [Mucilaginibacter yixingensis]|uniref:Glycosyltransferase involved in cell wall biosynthesis n=1 Tax=Mucilaginibacter yixingensis TaxID=1295612 RepID=A0A2T5JC53_9SPHI|nr:glycosyltransferase family 4 protein [Mucilaginibacter yixingensis]PTQ99336.1 glycosyltransferase involved in cell wall biosynthesis [Mucilaginibacter yixingensis]